MGISFSLVSLLALPGCATMAADTYTENPGIAFGMLNNGNMKWLLVAISIAAIMVVVYYIRRTPTSNVLLL